MTLDVLGIFFLTLACEKSHILESCPAYNTVYWHTATPLMVEVQLIKQNKLSFSWIHKSIRPDCSTYKFSHLREWKEKPLTHERVAHLRWITTSKRPWHVSSVLFIFLACLWEWILSDLCHFYHVYFISVSTEKLQITVNFIFTSSFATKRPEIWLCRQWAEIPGVPAIGSAC